MTLWTEGDQPDSGWLMSQWVACHRMEPKVSSLGTLADVEKKYLVEKSYLKIEKSHWKIEKSHWKKIIFLFQMEPSEVGEGYGLWFDELMLLWDKCNNAVAWEEQLSWLMARLAIKTVGICDWERHMSR
jgi:hypothetical protein